MTQLERAISEAVRRIYRSGRTGERLTRLINEEIKKAVKKYGSASDLKAARGHAKTVLQQLDADSWEEFKKNSRGAEGIQGDAANLVIAYAARLDGNDRKAVREITRAIKQARADDKPWREAAKAALVKTGLAEAHAATEAETAIAALDTANTINQAIEAGCKYFRYDGPTGTQRPFCKNHVGNVYHIADIRNMINGQGLSVLYYRGGFNCRHRWVPKPDYQP
jgi:hypothetical protein